MEPGVYDGAFGGGKAGGAQDPLTFVKRPAVVIRICALFFSIIVFGCVSSSGWFLLQDKGMEVCVMNMDSSACHFSTFVGIVAFIASIGFIVGEWFFEQMSSVKSRKHYVILDMAFSGLWAFFFIIAFVYMANSWRKSDDIFNFAKSNIIGAMFFAFLSIFCWLGSVGLAYQRYKAGSDVAFTQGLGDEGGIGEDTSQYDGDYGEPPFQGGGQDGINYHQQNMQY